MVILGHSGIGYFLFDVPKYMLIYYLYQKKEGAYSDGLCRSLSPFIRVWGIVFHERRGGEEVCLPSRVARWYPRQMKD